MEQTAVQYLARMIIIVGGRVVRHVAPTLPVATSLSTKLYRSGASAQATKYLGCLMGVREFKYIWLLVQAE